MGMIQYTLFRIERVDMNDMRYKYDSGLNRWLSRDLQYNVLTCGKV
jgi:hypothetical protein